MNKRIWNRSKSILCKSIAAVMILAMMLSVFAGCGKGEPITGCTVTVKSEGGMALEGVGVYIYNNEQKGEMLAYVKTDKDGKAPITVEIPAGGVAVLDSLPAGYVAAASYPITQADTQIALKAELRKEIGPITPGSIMFDFTTTDTEGNTYTLSEMLKTNKVVVLNLWYTNCGPCKAEFPYLQQAYESAGEGVALLALNCYPEDDADDVAAFKAEHGLSFPMAKVDSAWEQQIEEMAYPVTIVIDRYGMVSLMHIGGIDDAGVFAGVFQHYAADTYTQAVVEDIRSLAVELAPVGSGTQDSPFEVAGQTSFEVTVEPGATVYYNLYRLSGMELSIQSETAAVLFNGQEYLSNEGAVKCMIETMDPMTPALVGFTNKGTAAETYQVTLEYPLGSQNNPHPLTLGDLSVQVEKGNAQGLFYGYEASVTGEFTLTVKKASISGYSLALNNLTTGKYMTLSEDGVKDENGKMTLTVPVNRKDQLQIIVSADPDNQGEYPALKLDLIAAEKEAEVGQGGEGGELEGGSYEGTLANPDAPFETYGFNPFTIDVNGGEKMLVNIIRVFNTATFCLKDKDAYVVYKNKLYKPDSSGNIYISMTGEGTATPLVLEIGNSGTAAKTFSISFAFAKGTRENPNKLELGSNTVKCAANNDQGTFYTFKPSADGTLTLEVSNVPSNVIVGISASDMAEYPTVVELEKGATTLTIQLFAGVEAEIIFFTSDPDREWKIPKAEFTVTATYA